MLTNCLAACTHLSSTVSQLFEPQVQKIAIFTYCSPHFCFPWRRPCDYRAICWIPGLFVPLHFRSRERKDHRENFRSRGTFVPWNIRFRGAKSPRTFVPWNFRSCGTFAPQEWMFRELYRVFSLPGSKVQRNEKASYHMLHEWKDNSVLAIPLAACTDLFSIVSELYDA